MGENLVFDLSIRLNPVTKSPLLPNPPKTLLEPIKPKTQTTKQLTPAYMSERRAKGLSYFCDEHFTPAHSQTHKKLQIHIMEIDKNADSDVGTLDFSKCPNWSSQVSDHESHWSGKEEAPAHSH